MDNMVYVTDKKALAENLKKYRQKCGLSQEQTANKLHIDRSTYSYYEMGKTLPNVFTLIKISNIFRINLLKLLIVE